MNYDKLRALRDKSGLTIAEIAQRSGLPEATVKRIFGGKTTDPQFQTIYAIVKALGGSLDAIADDGIIDDTTLAGESIINDTEEKETEAVPAANIPDTSHDESRINKNESMEDIPMNPDTMALIKKIESTYEKLLDFKDSVIKQKDRWIYILSGAVALLILGLIAWLGYDITHPNVGWFQY